MKISSLILSTALLTFTALNFAEAQDAPSRKQQPAQQVFGKLDTNQDGALNKNEMTAASNERFIKMDMNGDGLLSQDEMQAHMSQMRMNMGKRMKKRMNEKFAAMDTNKDGSLSIEEFNAQVKVRHEKLDKNADNLVTKDEIRKQGRIMRKKRMQHRQSSE